MVVLSYCDKKDENNKAGISTDQSTPPPTVPAISTGTQLYDQLSHMAVNLAGIAENNAVNNIGATTFMSIITSTIPSGSEETPILTIDNALVTSPPTSPKFTLGTTSTSDFYQAVMYSSNNYSVTPAIGSPRLPDFYSGFTRSGKSYYTLLRIPEFAIQQTYNPGTHGSIIFIPRDVLGQTSYFGYFWNSVTSSVNSVALDDNAVEDHIDNSTEYIVVVDFDEISSSGSASRNASSCEGALSCTDGYCDSICGEAQSCLDCNTMFNKRLELTDILIKDDERTRTPSGNNDVVHKHFVSVLGGHYKVCLNAVVLHANGKFDAINGERLSKTWKKNEVKRVRDISGGGTVSRGTATWKKAELKNEPNKPVLLSNHFNIYQAKIYINLYEKDGLFVREHEFFSPSYNGSGINNTQSWHSVEMPSLTGPRKWAYITNNLPAVFQLNEVAVEILPTAWQRPGGGLYEEIEIDHVNVRFKLKVTNK